VFTWLVFQVRPTEHSAARITAPIKWEINHPDRSFSKQTTAGVSASILTVRLPMLVVALAGIAGAATWSGSWRARRRDAYCVAGDARWPPEITVVVSAIWIRLSLMPGLPQFTGMSNPHILHKSFRTPRPTLSAYWNIAGDDWTMLQFQRDPCFVLTRASEGVAQAHILRMCHSHCCNLSSDRAPSDLSKPIQTSPQ
jgi:hypothetical protein